MTLPAIPRYSHKVALQLREHLKTWTVAAQQELRQTSLSPDIPTLEQEILAEQREQHGSATVFFCGRIDFASPSRMRISHKLPALFCWMGNVTARVFTAAQKCEPLGDLQNDRNRWSTTSGQQGTLTVRVSALHKQEPLLIHTDGLDELSQHLALFDDKQLQHNIWQRLSLPTNDDMTVLEFRWAASRRSPA